MHQPIAPLLIFCPPGPPRFTPRLRVIFVIIPGILRLLLTDLYVICYMQEMIKFLIICNVHAHTPCKVHIFSCWVEQARMQISFQYKFYFDTFGKLHSLKLIIITQVLVTCVHTSRF